MIQLKRVYEPAEPGDGWRVLVERLWPRGVRRADLQMDEWAKDAAPSTDLRRWFGHDPAKWERFQERYREELDANPEAWRPLIAATARGPVTLLYSSHDGEHNNAVVLRQHLLERTAT